MRKIILILALIFVMGCVPVDEMDKAPFADRPMEASEEEGIQVTESGVKYLVDPSKIIGGGPPKD
ncbi:MAG: hypothetical protein V3V78_04480, partial [Candidatus Woesearchaeota archaeon]